MKPKIYNNNPKTNTCQCGALYCEVCYPKPNYTPTRVHWAKKILDEADLAHENTIFTPDELAEVIVKQCQLEAFKQGMIHAANLIKKNENLPLANLDVIQTILNQINDLTEIPTAAVNYNDVQLPKEKIFVGDDDHDPNHKWTQ